MTWHGDADLFPAYAAGEADEASSSSLEAHLVACHQCRAGLAAFAPRPSLDLAWAGIAADLDMPAPGVIERSLLAIGIPDHVARVLSATRSLRLSWFAALAITLGFAVGASYAGDRGVLLFLTIAPLVPLAGVAAAYGPGVDPTYEIGLAAPMRSFRLLLLRAVAVLATSIVVAGVAALALPVLNWTAAAWLLPSLALSAAVLAVSTIVRPLVAASMVAATWIALGVLAEASAERPFAAFHAKDQVAFLLVAILCAAVVARRREAFEIRRQR